MPDRVQDVFLKLYQAVVNRGLDVSRPVGGWLYRTARSVARDALALKRHKLEKLTSTGTPEPDEDTVGQETRMAEAIDVHEVIGRILDKLPPDTREVFVLSDLEDTPMNEIIKELRIPRATAYDRLKAGRKAFAREWEAMQASGDEAVAPFAPLGVGALLAAWRSTEDMPQGFAEDLLRRLHEQIGADLAGPASGTVSTGGAAAGAARAGLVTLKTWQLGLGAILAALAGAWLYALLTRVAPVPPAAVALQAPALVAHGSAAAPTGGTAAAPLQGAAVNTSGPPDAASSTAPPESQAKLLDSARALIRDHKPEDALVLLARVSAPEFVKERDRLRRFALSAARP